MHSGPPFLTSFCSPDISKIKLELPQVYIINEGLFLSVKLNIFIFFLPNRNVEFTLIPFPIVPLHKAMSASASYPGSETAFSEERRIDGACSTSKF